MDKAKFKKKVQKDYESFTNSVDGLQLAELEKSFLMYAKHKEETETILSDDDKIKDAKELLKELKGPYMDALKALKAKMSYLGILMKEKSEDGKSE